ncbi:MAG: endonuclease/exonuclease/phosphatase family protein [Planctomycetota bacterium]
MTTLLRQALVPCGLAVSLAACAATGQGDNTPPPELTVMSYNIHYAVGMDGERDLERIAQVILSADPDLVGLQEIGSRAMADELAELTGMQGVFGPAKGSENDYGDALLSKHPFEWVGGEALPTASASRYQAMAVDVDLSELYGPGASIRFINTHYDWTDSLGSQEARRASAAVIERGFFEDEPAASALAGDLNATPESLPLSDLAALGWHHSPIGQPLLTHGAPNPTVQIDFVLVRPHAAWEVVDVEVLDEPVASDHYPIVLTARLVR